MKIIRLQNLSKTLLLPALLSLLATGQVAYSATIVWTNTLGGNWSVAANWNPNQVPGSADTAQITTSGNYIVTNDQNSTVTSFTVGGSTGSQTLKVANGTVLTSASSSSTINANGSLTVASGGSLNLAGSAYLYMYGPVTNSGTINVTNGLIYMYNNGTAAAQGGLVNLSGGLINLDGTGGIQGNVYGAGSSYDYFINGGTVTKVTGSGSSSIAVAQETLAGIYNAAAGTTVLFSGGSSTTPLQEDPGLVLNGPGQYQFNGGFLLLAAAWNPGLQLTGGSLMLGPGFQGGSITNLALDGITLTNTLPVTGTLNVTNSTLTGSFIVTNGGVLSVGSSSTINANGSLTVTSGGAVNLAGSAYLYMYGPVTNSGTINVTNGYLYIYNNGTVAAQGGLVNLSGGLISLDGTGGIQGNVYGAGSSYDYFINGGTVTKVTGTGSSSIVLAQGVLAGTYNAAAGTIVQFSGGSSTTPLQEDPGLVLNGPGQYKFTGGYLLLAAAWNPGLQLTGGSLMLGPGFQGGAITNLALDGITLTNTLPVTGTLTVTNSGTLTGTFTVTNGGLLSVVNGSATLSPNGSLTVTSGGTVNLAGSAYLYLYGPLTNSGTINVTNGLIYMYNNGTAAAQGGLVNLSGGLISLDGTGGIQGNVYGAGSSYDYFLNGGTVTKITGTGTSSIVSAQGVLAGTYNAAAGTIVQFSGGSSTTPLQEDPGLVLNGPGQYKFTGGLLLLTANPNPNLQLTGGSLLLGPGFQGGSISNLVLDGINLTNTLTLTGTLIVTNGSVNGTIVVSNGAVLNANGATLTAQVTVQSGGEFLNSGSSYIYNTGSQTNNWLLVKNGGLVQLSGYLYLYGPLTNAGTINVTNGVSLIAYNNNSTTLQGGIVNQGSGVIDLWNNSSLTGASYGGEYLINQGTINMMNGSSSAINFNNLNLSAGTITTQPAVSAAGILQVEAFSGVGSLNGTYNAAANTIIQFAASTSPGTSPGSPLVLGGTGQYRFNAGLLTLPLNPIPGVVMTGGSLLLGPGFQGGSISNLVLDGINLTNTLTLTGTLIVTNGSVNGTIVVSNGAVLNVNGATLTAQVTVQSGGEFLTTGGSSYIYNTGSQTNNWLQVQNGGLVQLAGYLYLYGPLMNAGTINVTNGVSLTAYNNNSTTLQGGIVNQGSGVIDLWNNSSLTGTSYGNEYLINQGTINMMNGSSSAINFNNLNLSAGTITTQPAVSAAGILQVEAFSGVGGLNGTYNAAANTIIQFAASTSPGTSPGSPLVLGGTGQYRFNAGLLTLPLNPIPGVVMTGGSLLLGPGFQGGSISNLVLDGINLTNTLTLTGTLIVTNGSVNGTIVVSNGAVLNVNGATLTAQVTVQSGGEFLTTGGSSYIYNTGSQTNNWLQVQNGGLVQLAGYLYLYGPLMNAGTINVTNGVVLYAYNNGTTTLQGGIVNQASGVIDLWANSGLYGTSYGNEYLINQGTINMMNGSSSAIDFSGLTNQAVLSVQHGTLQVQGTRLNLQSPGILDVGLNSLADYGKFSLIGVVPLAGALQVTLNGSYIPVATNAFTVVSYPSLSGSFSSFILPNLQPGAVWDPVYGGTTLTLVLQQPIATQSSGSNVVVSINGTPGHQAILLTSTNLAVKLINWTPVLTNTFGITTYLGFTNNINPGNSQQFFIFKLP